MFYSYLQNLYDDCPKQPIFVEANNDFFNVRTYIFIKLLAFILIHDVPTKISF